MGYDTYITGDALVTPEVSAAHMMALTNAGIIDASNANYSSECYFRWGGSTPSTGGDTLALVNGQVTVIAGPGTVGSTEILLTMEESVRAYDFSEKVHEMVDELAKLGYKVNGAFDGDGENSDDFWRLNIADNTIQAMDGEIVFDRYEELRERGKNGHGWVIPRDDTNTAKCGGTAGCPACKADRAWLRKLLYG